MNKCALFIMISVLISCFGCKKHTNVTPVIPKKKHLSFSKNILNYRVTPKDSMDKSGLMFSDQGSTKNLPLKNLRPINILSIL